MSKTTNTTNTTGKGTGTGTTGKGTGTTGKGKGKERARYTWADTSGTGQHTVMKHGSGAPQQVRLQAGDINACMKLIETLPECPRQP